MRKLKLLFALLALIVGGSNSALAYTVDDLTSAGWTKVTSITDVDNYYYVFIDAGTSNYAMGRLSYGTDRPVYMPLADPLGFAGAVWYLGTDNDKYTIKNLGDDKFFISGTAGWNDSMNDNQYTDEGRFTFTLNSGKYDIQSVKTNSYVGPWNNDNKVSLSNGYENVAANKDVSQAPGFYLYSMARSEYNAKRITASWLTSHGWSQVTDNSALGNASNYYLIIEKVSFGYALARTTNGRPASKSLSNPFATPNELWLTAAHGSGYTFQNVIDNTYFTSAAGDWNTSMSNTPNADIIATLNDGIYTLSAGGTSSIGHWRDDAFFPYENENVAANKSDANRNSYYIYTISKTDYATQRAAYIASLAASATSDAPVDLTNFVFNNSDFALLGKFGWTVSGSWGNQQTGNGAYETWNSNNVSVTQELTGLPGGKYQLSVQMVSGDAGRVPYLYASADDEYTANVTQQATTNTYDGMRDEIAADPSYGLITVTPYSSNGTITVGMKAPSGWVVFDNFKLKYYGPTLGSTAVELPNGGDMVADTWYYFDIAVAGDNYLATATTLGDIICTTDGNTLLSDATGTITLKATDNFLSAGRYYVKSSSANNLVVEAASYSYSVSSATADMAYIQSGNTVTVSFDCSTNNPGATLDMDFSGVTFNSAAISVTSTANGFTFTVPGGVTANTEYTLAIPAKAIGYEDGKTYNAAQDITLKTPAVFDGTYFFKVENTGALKGQYLSRGKNYGTHATIDKYGLAIKVATDAQNKTTLKPYDTDRYYRMDGNGYDCWADNTDNDDRAKFNLIVYNNHILIHGITSGRADDYFKYNDSDVDETTKVWGDSHGTDGSNGNAIEFSLEDAAAHATAMQTMKDNQAASAAAAAYASGNYASLNGITTVAALEAELTANYIQGDFVSPSAIESVLEKYEGTQPGSANTVETVYSNTINITEPGFYKFSMQAFYRASNNDRTKAMHEAGIDFNPVVLFFGDAQTQIKSVYDESSATALSDDWGNLEYKGAYYPNNMAASLKAFQNDEYHNDVWFYAAAAGTYTYGVKYLGFANANAQWFIYSPESVTITSYAAAADATDYDNLAKAISEAEGKVIGFEEGEYAPYNNIDAVAFIATAKAIDTEATNSKLLIQSAITALSEWTVNEEELNAFYDGDFSECAEDNASPLDYTPAGWTASDNMRMMLKNTETYPGLVDASAKSAMMSWSGGITYGETTGYTMPLKANTIYKLTFKAAGWNDETRSGITVSVLNTEDGMAAQNLGTPDRDIKAAQTWNTAGMTSYEVLFVTGAAGNYVFHVQSGNNMVLTDFEIKKAASQVLEFADGSVPTYAPGTYPTVKISRTLTENKWATAIYPFEVSGVESIAVLSSYDNANNAVGFSSADYSEANKPFLMKSSATMNNIELKDVVVEAAIAKNDVKEPLSFIGVYKETEVGRGENVKNFVLKDNTIYRVGDNAATINPYRAYFQVDQPGEEARLKFFINGQQTTDIEGVKAEKSLNGVIYNLNGQRVEKANKGLYISNGKKVVLK